MKIAFCGNSVFTLTPKSKYKQETKFEGYKMFLYNTVVVVLDH